LLAEASVASLLNEAPMPAHRLRVEPPAATVLASPSELEQQVTELGDPPIAPTRRETET